MHLLSEKNNNNRFGDDKMQILFGSKTRVGLLKLFLSSVDEAYYVRELSRLINAQINAIRRELANLVDLGIIEINEEKNFEKDMEDIKSGKVVINGIKGVEKKYYQLNKNFVLYPELRNLFLRMNGLTKDAFIDRVKELGDITLFLLSGIFIKDEKSEVDVLIVGNINRDELQTIINEYNDKMIREINYTLLTEDEFYYRQEVVDRFLYNLLQNVKNEIIIDKRNERVSKK